MKNPFRTKGPPDKRIVESGTRRSGFFHMFWERRRMPDPGAQNYAFESLALAPFTPIGPTVATRQPLQPILPRPQPYYQKQVVLNGIPTNSGAMVMAPLYDPSAIGTGYTGQLSPLNNQPFDKHNMQPAGEII